MSPNETDRVPRQASGGARLWLKSCFVRIHEQRIDDRIFRLTESGSTSISNIDLELELEVGPDERMDSRWPFFLHEYDDQHASSGSSDVHGDVFSKRFNRILRSDHAIVSQCAAAVGRESDDNDFASGPFPFC